MKLGYALNFGVNDDKGVLISWSVKNHGFVKKNQKIAEIETTKAIVDIESVGDGCINYLLQPGETISIRDVFYVLSDAPLDDIKDIPRRYEEEKKDAEPLKKSTKKAELLAKKYNLDLSKINVSGVIKEEDVQRYLDSNKELGAVDLVDDIYGKNAPKRVLVIGAGQGAVQVLDILMKDPQLRPIGLVDDRLELQGKSVMGLPVLGDMASIYALWKERRFDQAIISITSNLSFRKALFEKLTSEGISFCNAIDSNVSIHSNVTVGVGNIIIAGCRLGSCASLGDNNFLSAFCNIEHHNILGSHVTFGPGVMTSGDVKIGDKCIFGTGIFVEPGLKIGSGSTISSGSIIVTDIPENSLVKTKINIKISQKK